MKKLIKGSLWWSCHHWHWHHFNPFRVSKKSSTSQHIQSLPGTAYFWMLHLSLVSRIFQERSITKLDSVLYMSTNTRPATTQIIWQVPSPICLQDVPLERRRKRRERGGREERRERERERDFVPLVCGELPFR